MHKLSFILFLVLILFGGCDFRKVEKGDSSLETGMKCGAGKCGANMFDASSALGKKKNNILSQMRNDDSRKECVKNALTTKEAYDCVREPDGKKLTVKCGSGESVMKCEAGKCGSAMQSEPVQQDSIMKCEAGKCGAAMPEETPKKENVMKCAPGRCGSSM